MDTLPKNSAVSNVLILWDEGSSKLVEAINNFGLVEHTSHRNSLGNGRTDDNKLALKLLLAHMMFIFGMRGLERV